MKKEILIAAAIGIFLGFAVTGIFWFKKEGKLSLNLSLSPKSEEDSAPTEEPSPTPTQQNEEKEEKISLEILEPENESVTNESGLTIKGKTVPEATLIIVWEDGEDILIADKNGLFETEIELTGGENLIEISAFDDSGHNTSDILTVTYSTAKF
ncbi:MAG: hypothetical protein ABH867_03395 [Patescibacteria group bacterium]|nr:hypothetical protein [Patescibacteria group bacterium]